MMHGVGEGKTIVLVAVALALMAPLSALAYDDATDKTLSPETRFFVPQADTGAVQQVANLAKAGDLQDAFLIGKVELSPRAVWLTGGTPEQVAATAADSIRQAHAQDAVPVFVLYNIPGRDCGGFSAGGAQTTPDYEAWIDAIATAVGDRRAIIILEPDGLANLPSDCGLDPTGQLTADRFTQLSYAVNALES